MPSAAKQRIPAEMWRSNHNRLSGSSPVPLPSQDIQAHPGQYDMSDVDGLKINNGKRSFSTKSSKRFSPSNRRNGRSLPRRGSTDALNESCTDSKSVTYEMSTSPDSDSGLYYCSLESSNSFALDSVEAPHPSRLPLPPPEWLGTAIAADKGSSNESLQSFLGCFPPAQDCA